MTLTQATASYVIDQTISAFAFNEFPRAAPVMPSLMGQRGSSSYEEAFATMGGLGDFQEKTPLQAPAESTPTQQYIRRFVHAPYALTSGISRETMDDARFSFFSSFGKKLGQSAVRTVEKAAAAVFYDGFNSEKTEDGQSLFSATHTNVDGNNNQVNRGALDLTKPNVGTTRTAMRAWKDYDGENITTLPDTLIIPGAQEDTAIEILRSTLDPTSAGNAVNPQAGRFQMVVWDYLDRNSTLYWYLADSRALMDTMLYFWRIPLEIFGDGDLQKGKRTVGGYYRSAWGVTDWRAIYGQAAT